MPAMPWASSTPGSTSVTPTAIVIEERVPGEPRPVSADLLSGREMAGRPPRPRPGDDALGAGRPGPPRALRRQRRGRPPRRRAPGAGGSSRTQRLLALDAEKDDFLRGISHNLQTPLARIRAYADQLAGEVAAAGGATPAGEPDRRPAIIAEQSERLSRMVRQLLTVSRLDSGVLRPVAEVFALGPRVRRAWEALGAGEVPFELDDEAGGWLALADPDQVDQVLWALLDNAVKYGGGAAVRVHVSVEPAAGRVAVTVADGGPGVADADRERLFARYARGGRSEDRDGTGLGLYVGRALARANGGDLVLEPADAQAGQGAAGAPGAGATFTLVLPAEAPTEG